jgi:hypothetical protein
LASQALIEQVFTGVFDDDPGLTRGCLASSTICYAATAYNLGGSINFPTVTLILALNDTPPNLSGGGLDNAAPVRRQLG